MSSCPLPDASVHGKISAPPVEYDAMLDQTGCRDLNDAVLECIADTRDWRQCQTQVQAFRECFEQYQRQKEKELEGRE